MTRLGGTYKTVVEAICRSAFRRPALWIAASLLLCVPAALQVRKIHIDANLVRLLPQHSRAAKWTRQLGTVVGDGGYFTVLIEGDPERGLSRAAAEVAARAASLEGVESVSREHPVEFLTRYRYLLIPPRQLRRIQDYLVELQSRASPFTEDLVGGQDEAGADDPAEKARRDAEFRRLLWRYGKVSAFHESDDGRIMGVFIRPSKGFTDMASSRLLLRRLEEAAADVQQRYGLSASVGGAQVRNLREYETIIADVRRAGTISLGAIVVLLVVSFASVRILPVLLYPLGAGLVWAYGLVPTVVGDLNLITSFLLMVVFGVGIEFSIHLVKRFQRELLSHPPEQALVESYASTGLSVISSGLTTSLPLFILAFLDFKGFSEFGIVGGGSILVVLTAIFLVLPPAIALGHRLGAVRPAAAGAGRGWLPPLAVTGSLVLLILGSAALAATRLEFDYDFNNLSVKLPAAADHDRRHREVYGGSYSASAVFVAPDMETLDATRGVFTADMSRESSPYDRTGSVRDYTLPPGEFAERIAILEEIREEVRGGWIDRVEDEQMRARVREFLAWTPPPAPPRLEELPESVRRGLFTRDGTARPVLGVWPSGSGRNGRDAMAFTEQLYGLALPPSVLGPLGEMPVFAEILWLVRREGPRVVAITLLGILALVYLSCMSFRGTLLVMFPLVGGVILALGVMTLAQMKLNFFNVVAIPALLGMAVDNGVHYHHRWVELARDTRSVQAELFGPVSVCTFTNMLGYAGLMFTNHPGLRSIGQVACLGMGCLWLTSGLLLPALLNLRWRSSK